MVIALAFVSGVVLALTGADATRLAVANPAPRTRLRQAVLSSHSAPSTSSSSDIILAHDSTRFARDDDEPDIVASIKSDDMQAEITKDITSQTVTTNAADTSAAERLASTSSSGSPSNVIDVSSLTSTVTTSEADTANAVHLSCGIMLTYIASDIHYYKEKVIQGVKLFIKVVGKLVKSAGDFLLVLAKAVKARTYDRLVAAAGSHLPDDASKAAFTEVVDAPDKESFWSKFKTFVKKLATFKHFLKFLDFVWSIITTTLLPATFGTVQKVVKVSAWILGKLVPASLSNAQSRCLACALGMPPRLQSALVLQPGTTSFHSSVCGVSTGGTGGSMLESKDSNLDFSDALRDFAVTAAADGRMADVKLALHVAGDILKTPFSTIRSVSTPEMRKELKASFAMPAKRLSMASSYMVSTTPAIVNKYLDKFIEEARAGGSRYERNKTPWKYMARPWDSTAETQANRDAFADELRRLKSHSAPVSNMFETAEVTSWGSTGIEEAAA